MTATELYEIVKDHRDVWGELLYNEPNGIGWFDVLADTYISDSAAEAALLGLGVKWIVKNSDVLMHEHQRGGYVVLPMFEPSFNNMQPARGPSELAAVYAAVAEVKKEVPNG